MAWLKAHQSKWVDPALYGMVGGCAVALVFFAFRILNSLPRPRTYLTQDNAGIVIREWLDALGYGIQKTTEPTARFNYGVTLPNGKKLTIFQQSSKPQYIGFATSLSFGESELKRMNLDLNATRRFVQDVCISLATAHIAFDGIESPPKKIVISKGIPITSDLTEYELVNGVVEMELGHAIIIATFNKFFP